ncbi:MAG: hypothetical protein GY719_26235 [bacterium]|nr:hypothetical protein [bacterium]
MKIIQGATLFLALAAAVLGRAVEFSEEQVLALALAGAGIYQLVARYVLHRQAADLGLPDPRIFYGVTTSWMVLANAVLALILLFGGAALPLPEWTFQAAQLLAFAVGQMRLQAASARVGTRKELESLRAVAGWRRR